MRIAALAVALLSSACASSGEGASAGSARMVKPEDLPPEQREVLEHWRAGGATWDAERERIAADPELSRFLVDNLVIEMVRSFDRSAITTAARPNAPFERARDELVALPQASTPVLVELLAVEDGVVAFLAADALERIGGPALEGASRKLADPDPEVRRRAAELLAELPHAGEREPAVQEALGARISTDEAWIVRAQAARALAARAGRHEQKGYAAAVLSRALADADPEVARTAMAALTDLGEASVVPVLIRRLERCALEGDLAGLRPCQAALRRLTGEKRDLDPEEWWKLWESRRPSGAASRH